jgi:hypothetical protein
VAVDPLIETHLEITLTDFFDPLLPVGLSEEIVIQQDEVAWVRLLAPSVPDGLLLGDGSLFLGTTQNLHFNRQLRCVKPMLCW